ncbi:MAG: site-2 protease family protein [Poseidonia sp.]
MAQRDPRADMLRDDPFSRKTPPQIHRVHAGRDEGSLRFETSSPLTGALMQFLGQEAWEKPKHHTGRLWHFSETEKQHLRLAMGAFTLALGFMAVRGLTGLSTMGVSAWVVMLLLSMPVMFIAIGPAFLFHEIGHKLVAKKHGCWAEFRADPKGLQFGIVLSLLLGFLFMAPGAVMVAGLVTRRQNGHIAVAGPLTNFGLFLVGIPLWGLLLGLTGAFEVNNPSSLFQPTYVVNGALVWQAMLIDAGVYWLSANLILGLFNMLPFGPLDGLKVKDWNEQVFFGVLGVFAVLVFTMFTGVWSPIDVLYTVAHPISGLIR